VVYVGSVSGVCLVEEMARFFLALRRLKPDAFLQVLTQEGAADASGLLARTGLPAGAFAVGSCTPADVPGVLRRARLGLSFRQPTFAQIAACPTKIPEYLAAGVPVVSNEGIGDIDALLLGAHVGVVVRRFDEAAFAEAARDAVRLSEEPGIRVRCMAAASEHFDLDRVGGARYRAVYEGLFGRGERRGVPA
jgi:glycosyltransferase involved in cell wall biosynthesis